MMDERWLEIKSTDRSCLLKASSIEAVFMNTFSLIIHFNGGVDRLEYETHDKLLIEYNKLVKALTVQDE